MYHVPVHSLAERVLGYIRRQELLKAGDRVGVAVSGGIDSVALLRLLLELRGKLGIVLSVVHFNHKLRGAESDGDQEFVAALAREHDLEFFGDSDDVSQHAAEEHVSLEAAARELRYRFFRYLIGEDRDSALQGLKPLVPNKPPLRGPEGPLFHGAAQGVPFSAAYDGAAEAEHFPDSSANDVSGFNLEHTAPSESPVHLDKIATGHTLDDQAETVLMRMIRGAGLRGLGGIYPRILVEDDDDQRCGEIVRPLLAIRHRELEQYLRELGQSWREDSTNADAALTRNRVRKRVVPLLESEFNPAVAENLAELAEIARGEEDYWENEIAGWMGTAVHWSEPEWTREARNGAGLVQIGPVIATKDEAPRGRSSQGPVRNASVSRLWFLGESTAAQRRLVKAIGENAGIPLEFKHVEEILRFAAEDGASGKELSLPLGWKLVREPQELVFFTPDSRKPSQERDYEYEIPVPGSVAVPEAGSMIEVLRIPAQRADGDSPDHLLDAESVTGSLRVRNWRPGDRFWPAHTRSPKKIKELLQERHVAQPERRLWPVVVSESEIVWVRGFSPPTRLRAKARRDAISIVEKPLPEKAK